MLEDRTLPTNFQGGVSAIAGALAIQSDGKIVAAGHDDFADLFLIRYNLDGSLDTSFGAGGRVSTMSFGNDVARLGLQSDGKIVVFGGSTGGFALARYNSDGSLDATFGSGGRVFNRFDVSINGDDGAIQPDGKIIEVGTGLNSQGIYEVVIARYKPDGSVDTGFGANGIVTHGLYTLTASVSILSDSKIVVASGGILLRFNPGGGLDNGFGQGGVVNIAFIPAHGYVQPDNKLLVLGGEGATLGLERFNTDGSLDFHVGLGPIPNLAGSLAENLAIQRDGRIIVSGEDARYPYFSRLVLVRLDANGKPDTSFGTNGQVTSPIPDFGLPQFIAIEPDQKIVVLAATFTLARFNPDGSLDTGFGSNGSVMTTGFGTPSQRFVAQVYADLLHREPDPGGFAFFTNLLDQGSVDRSQVVLAIENSQEYRSDMVTDVYSRFLGRTPDPAGLSGWVGFLGQGGTTREMEALIIGSPEYLMRRAGETSLGWLQAVYQDVLGRAPDPAGLAFWKQILNKGEDEDGTASSAKRREVATSILMSAEATQDRVQNWYELFLHRQADPLGLSALSLALQQGLADEQAVALLVGSEEYFSTA